MTTSWTEVWSFGLEPSRTYCVVERTEDGYAVDIFHGYTCLEAAVYATHDEAHGAAVASRARYRTADGASRKARAFSSRRVIYGAWPAVAQSADGSRRRHRQRAV
jgi:hypothetical protein